MKINLMEKGKGLERKGGEEMEQKLKNFKKKKKKEKLGCGMGEHRYGFLKEAV